MANTTHTAKCLRCARSLTSAKSIANGMGRTCKAKVTAAAQLVDVSAFKDQDAARAKAADILDQAALIPTSRTDLYKAVSSDATQTYLVDVVEGSCDCKAGLRLGRCSHLVAAQIVTLSRPTLQMAA